MIAAARAQADRVNKEEADSATPEQSRLRREIPGMGVLMKTKSVQDGRCVRYGNRNARPNYKPAGDEK
jgi:hypothetical protein